MGESLIERHRVQEEGLRVVNCFFKGKRTGDGRRKLPFQKKYKQCTKTKDKGEEMMPEFQVKVKGIAIKNGEYAPRNIVIEIQIKDAIDIQDARFQLATNWVLKKGIFSKFTFLTKPKFEIKEIKPSETKPN